MTRSRRATHPAFWRVRQSGGIDPRAHLPRVGLSPDWAFSPRLCREADVAGWPGSSRWCALPHATTFGVSAFAGPVGLLRQTNRSSRFAQVTVEVAASSRPEVEVTATAADEHRREAELGARWALRGLPTAAKVTVTDVVITEIDTSVGDVYEATAHAVWQALRVEHRAPYVGFS